jgi:hypothetical protein
MGKQVSINGMYNNNPRINRRFLSAKGRAFKLRIEEAVEVADKSHVVESDWAVLFVTFGIPLRFKNGNVRKWDVTNHLKAAEDAFAKAMGGKKAGWDDSKFLYVIGGKVDIPISAEPYTVMEVQPVELGAADE